MSVSLYTGKLLIGGATVLVGTAGTVYLTKDKIWPQNELKELTFLPWDCRNSSNSQKTCKLKLSDLKNTPFVFSDSVKGEAIDTKSGEANLKWEARSSGVSPLDLLFTISPGANQIDLKKGNSTINLAANVESIFQLKTIDKKYYLHESKLTNHDIDLIKEIQKLGQYTVSTSGQATTITPPNSLVAKISSLVVTVTTPSTEQEKKVALKVEITNSNAEDQKMTTWKCIIQGTASESNKALSATQISEFKKSFGITSDTGQKTWNSKHKESMTKFIEKCSETASAKPTLSEKKLTRTISDWKLTKVSEELKFEGLEDFFVPQEQ